jgi:hypothetical protein
MQSSSQKLPARMVQCEVMFHWKFPHLKQGLFAHESKIYTTSVRTTLQHSLSKSSLIVSRLVLQIYKTESGIPLFLFYFVRIMGVRVAQSAQWLGYGMDDRGSIPGRGNDGIFFPLRNRVQADSGALFPRVKWSVLQAGHSAPSSAEVKNAWSCTSTPSVRLLTSCLIKQGIRFHGVVLPPVRIWLHIMWRR